MQAIAWLTLWYVLFRNKLEVHGAENVAEAMRLHREGQGIILASNHFSELDPGLVFVGMSPFRRGEFPTYFVAGEKKMFKDSKFGWRRFIYGGFIFHLSGSFPIRSGTKDYAAALKTHIELLKGGKNVCIFPEGKMVVPGERPRAHGGVAYMGEAADAPILPIAIARTGNVITVTYRPLIWVENLAHEHSGMERYREAAQNLMQQIRS